MFNVGLIGAGRIAGVHARAIQANPDSIPISIPNPDFSDHVLIRSPQVHSPRP